ncbi:dephospho-CoA kinase [Catenovulum sediminis]|uniref:Dephospho-CoA kinase n=1 Tax=Catenovulum sediminis TaxID=1740262 RepID=A0ABV1RLK3_9ALTE|nr:dephospho-CoA kinase [Catenovulum sediminis]
MSNFIVGLTGGIGSGKSTVAQFFADFDIRVIDADVIAREVVAPGSPCLQKITDHFGNAILTDENSLDRDKLRHIVFTQPAAKNWLNRLLHPVIRENMLMQCKTASSPYCLLVVPLLIENNLQHLVNRILVCDCLESTQIKRTMLRDNNSQALVEKIMHSQIDRANRLKAADDIVDTEAAITEVEKKCQILHQFYLKLANCN